MALDDTRDRLKEQVQALLGRIQESSAWNQIVEKYQDQSPGAQKAILFASGALIALILLAVPYIFYSSSETYLEDFENRKAIIREAYRVNHDVSALPPSPRLIDVNEIRNIAQSAASTQRLQPDQSGPITEFDNLARKPGFIPKGLKQNGASVAFMKLNLDQIMQIGQRFQTMGPTVKMTGVRIQATPEDPHYFNVTYDLVAFNLPPEPAPKTPGRPGAARSANRPGAGETGD